MLGNTTWRFAMACFCLGHKVTLHCCCPQAILCRYNEDTKQYSALPLTKDHSPTQYEERMRIQKAGGHVRYSLLPFLVMLRGVIKIWSRRWKIKRRWWSFVSPCTTSRHIMAWPGCRGDCGKGYSLSWRALGLGSRRNLILWKLSGAVWCILSLILSMRIWVQQFTTCFTVMGLSACLLQGTAEFPTLGYLAPHNCKVSGVCTFPSQVMSRASSVQEDLWGQVRRILLISLELFKLAVLHK